MIMTRRYGVVVGVVVVLAMAACGGSVDLRTMPDGEGDAGAGVGSGGAAGATGGSGGSGGSTGGQGTAATAGKDASAGAAPEEPNPQPSCLDEPDCPWSVAEDMPFHIRGQAIVPFEGGFYLFGGASPELDDLGDDSDDPDHTRFSTVYHFDSASKVWTKKARMLGGLISMTAHVLGDKIYVFGGYGSGGFDPRTQVYDPATDTWTEAPPMPTSRYTFSSEVVDGKVYVIGGQGPTADTSTWEQKRAVEVFDTATGWSSLKSVPRTVSGYASCSLEGHIYAFGGETGNRTQIYDVATNTWSEATRPPVARNGHSCVRVGSSFLLLGGRDGRTSVGVVELYEPATDTWSTLDPLPTPRYWYGPALADSKLFVFGGENESGLLSNIEILDVSSFQ